MFRLEALYIIDTSNRGRGMACRHDISAQTLIEVCPVIVLPPADLARIHASKLHDYYFLWEQEGETAIALGYGSLYNHDNDSNADYEMDFESQTISIIAKRDISANEEICIDYTDGVDRGTLWW